jgi:hypothetical protein
MVVPMTEKIRIKETSITTQNCSTNRINALILRPPQCKYSDLECKIFTPKIKNKGE